MIINMEWKDQHGNWHRYQSKQDESDAYRVTHRRPESAGKSYHLVDDAGRLVDLLS